MSEPLQPYFWIRRNGDTFVPLIPVDELPSWVALRGISATKNWQDVCRGEMKFLGDHVDHDGNHYTVDIFRGHAADSEYSHDEFSDSGSSSATPTETTPKKEAKTAVGSHGGTSSGGVDRVQANIDKITSDQNVHGATQEVPKDISQSVPHYQGTAGTLGKKVYCTYWIRTGNCNYMQEGCKYKHEIPPDDDTRLAIGVRTYPTWPREDPVSAPRPPPVKVFQPPKPALEQPSWRRGDVKVSNPTHQKLSRRTSLPPAPARGGQSTQAPIPGASGPVTNPLAKFASANSAPHFPSHSEFFRLQQSQDNTGMANATQGKGRNQQADPTKAGLATRQAPAAVHHSQPGGSSNIIEHSLLPSKPLARQPSSQDVTPVINNPFAQRVVSNSDARRNVPASDFGFGAENTSNTGGPSNEPPPYMPIQTPNTAFKNNGNTHAGSHDPIKVSANAPATASSYQTSSTNAETSSSRVYTPISSSNITQGAFNGNPNAIMGAKEHDADIASNAATRGDLRSTSNDTSPARHNSKAPFSFLEMDPAIVSSRAQTPANVKGRGPVLYNPKAEGTTSAVEGNSNRTQFQDARSAMVSPPPMHRRLFRAPGEPEYVANPLEEAHSKSHRTLKKHVSGSSHGKGKKGGSSNKHHPRSSGQGGNEDLLG